MAHRVPACAVVRSERYVGVGGLVARGMAPVKAGVSGAQGTPGSGSSYTGLRGAMGYVLGVGEARVQISDDESFLD